MPDKKAMFRSKDFLLRSRAKCHRHQSGVVLFIALVMLVIISILASISIRTATSTEAVSANARTTELAMQAAEVALHYCETSTVQIITGTGTFTTTFVASNIQPYSSTPKWSSTTLWDTTPTVAFVLPTASLNQAGVSTTFSRMPECMVETVPMADTSSPTLSTSRAFVVTARGFGPEVPAADSSRNRPVGSEVWLQSTIELE